jgi:PAS domain S-box-containing protein
MSLDIGQTIQTLVDSAVEWSVPVVALALTGWWAIRRKQFAAWRKARQERAQQFADMLASYSETRGTVTAILKEVQPNGGGSLADAVRRTEALAQQHGSALEEVRGILRAQSDLSDDGAFQCTPAGSFTFVNLTIARLLGVGKEDLKGNLWKNYLAPADAMRFLAALAAVLGEHRPMVDEPCQMQRPDGTVVKTEWTVYPDPERPPAQRWFGRVRVVV